MVKADLLSPLTSTLQLPESSIYIPMGGSHLLQYQSHLARRSGAVHSFATGWAPWSIWWTGISFLGGTRTKLKAPPFLSGVLGQRVVAKGM